MIDIARFRAPSLLSVALVAGALVACNPTPGESESATAGESESDSGTDTDGEPEPLEGYADLHLHMFAKDAFGGGWLHGAALGDPAVALALCDGGSPGDHARVREDISDLIETCDQATIDDASSQAPLLAVLLAIGGDELSNLLGEITGTQGDTGEHLDRKGGWPELDGWPRWDTIAHQQSWEGWLKDAYDSGLRIEVISAVSFDWLCKAAPTENVARPQCDEMDDVRVQLEKANQFADANDWVEIALTAEDARRIVSEDKLALILSIEASHIFGDGDWRAQLDEVYGLGVRTLQLVHQLDNRFGGAAPHNPMFHVAQFTENCHVDADCGITSPDVTLGFDVDANCRNVLGLTAEGRELIDEMIGRGMLIDLAHMSEALVSDVYDVAVTHDYYPLYFSHAHFREIMLPEKQKQEKTTPAYIVKMVRETGGMIGLRTGAEEVNTYEPSAVDNSCHGSSRSFAQAYDYGSRGLKVDIGFGADFNGFIQQLRPRFGDDACSGSFTEERRCQAKEERLAGLNTGTHLDDWGLAHTGLLGAVLDDLDSLGSDTAPLRGSADTFVRMWERAAGERSGAADDAADMDESGVTVLPAHSARRAEYPSECDETYCPGGLVAGDSCRFDAECESGTCAGAGECGEPRGACE